MYRRAAGRRKIFIPVKIIFVFSFAEFEIQIFWSEIFKLKPMLKLKYSFGQYGEAHNLPGEKNPESSYPPDFSTKSFNLRNLISQ